MRLLLDTHTFLWWHTDDSRLTANVRDSVRDTPDVFVSAASAWEISIKQALGKLEGFSAAESVGRALTRYGFSELPVSIAHAERVLTLPMHHRDPFDRLLVAQCLCEGLVLVTRPAARGLRCPNPLDLTRGGAREKSVYDASRCVARSQLLSSSPRHTTSASAAFAGVVGTMMMRRGCPPRTAILTRRPTGTTTTGSVVPRPWVGFLAGSVYGVPGVAPPLAQPCGGRCECGSPWSSWGARARARQQ